MITESHQIWVMNAVRKKAIRKNNLITGDLAKIDRVTFKILCVEFGWCKNYDKRSYYDIRKLQFLELRVVITLRFLQVVHFSNIQVLHMSYKVLDLGGLYVLKQSIEIITTLKM